MRQVGAKPEIVMLSPQFRVRAAFALAVVVDALQLAILPMFIEGAASPADDALDMGVGAAMVFLLGWHWEFLPSFAGKLLPGVDLVPLWTLAVANVYRKQRHKTAAEGPGPDDAKTVEGIRNP
jgi:hypothetical protein